MRTKPSRGFSLLMAILFVVVLFLSFGVGFLSYINPQTYSNCLVDSKDRAASSDGGSDMRVYSSCGVFMVQDMPFNGEFDSANTYASINEGETYDFDTTGYRIPFYSIFPVIREVK